MAEPQSLADASSPFTLADFRRAARDGRKLAMLTAYDFTSARLFAEAGVKLLLVGDSAANVILGHPSTQPVPLDFMIEITAAVRRAAPNALVCADMPFGSFAPTSAGIRNTLRMVKLSGCDCVKIEATRGHIGLVQALADNGVAVFAHLGLTPQSVSLLGGYRAQGKTALEAMNIADLATDFVNAGAVGILLEAVPPQVSQLVVQQVNFAEDDATASKFIPVIGCGAGPACHAHVVVSHDLLGLSPRQPRLRRPSRTSLPPRVRRPPSSSATSAAASTRPSSISMRCPPIRPSSSAPMPPSSECRSIESNQRSSQPTNMESSAMMSKSNVSRTIATAALSVLAYVGASRYFVTSATAESTQPVKPQTLKIDPETLKHLDEFSNALRAVGQLMEPSVVEINVVKNAEPAAEQKFDLDGDGNPDPIPFHFQNPDQGPVMGEGSGVIMEVNGDTGYVLTNNHVAGGATKLTINLADGRRIDNAKVLGVDPKSDLAVVQITAKNLVPARWGDSDALERGDIVMAFGAPFGYVGSMSQGIVSGKDRQASILGPMGYEYFIQTDAVINPGNSGGPLVDIHGNVIGINAAIATRNGVFNGIGFAIPINQAKAVYEQLRDNGKVVRGYLGVEIGDVAKVEDNRVARLGYKDTTNGVFVSRVTESSPSWNVLRANDIITSIDGKPVKSTQELRLKIAALKPGTTVKLGVWRDKAETTVDVKLGEQPEQVVVAGRQVGPQQPGLANREMGMRLATPSDEQLESAGVPEGSKGALVTRVSPNSPAAMAGVKAGDLITRVGDTEVKSAEEAQKALKDADLGEGVTLTIRNREGESSVFIQKK
ncbi:MAG: 3-methyl-2-oxobutanoate hydroxymethyltransferase [Tepidisphaeraceae bacterium]